MVGGTYQCWEELKCTAMDVIVETREGHETEKEKFVCCCITLLDWPCSVLFAVHYLHVVNLSTIITLIQELTPFPSFLD